MMNSLTITIALMAVVTALLLFFFRKRNREIRFEFSEKIVNWKKELEVHDIQMERRSSGLNRYDFLKYNLGEALVVQPEIKI